MNIKAQLLIVYAASSWGMTGIVTRNMAAAGFSYYEISALRVVFSAIFMIVFMFMTNRQALKIKVKDLWVFVCMAAVGSAFMTTLYFITMSLIELAAASVLLYTAPYMAMVMSAIVFKEKVTPQKLAALLIAFTGCVMTVGFFGSADLNTIGVLMGLASAFCYALNTIIAKIAVTNHDPFAVATYVFCFAGVMLLPFCDFSNVAVLIVDPANIKSILIISLLISVLPSMGYYIGLKTLEPGRVLIIAFVEPLAAACAGFIVFDEVLTPVKMLGMGLIFLSLIVLNLRGR